MNFQQVLTAAVADFAEHGYDSEQRLRDWVEQIRAAAQAELVPDAVLQVELERTFRSIYERLIERGGILRSHPGISRYTIDRIRPELRDELNRRILASADLIRLNRENAIRDTLQRFSGWATSVPPGGSEVVKKREVKVETRKDLARLGFQVRRVAIDQGHKFSANLSQIVALGSDAIAMQWHQHYTRYPRHTHKLRDGRWYLIRNSWAHEAGLVRPGKAGYLDEVTQPGEEVFCRCSGTYVYAIRRLPRDMLTKKGAVALEQAEKELAA